MTFLVEVVMDAAVIRSAGPAFDASLALEMMGFGSPEAREGLASFREKRPPVFMPPPAD